MVFPHYLVGIGIPLIVGLLGIGFYLYQQSNEYNQEKYRKKPDSDTRHNFNFSTGDNCAICLEELESPIQHLPCTHKLHRMCYQKLIRHEKRCPECRLSFSV